MMAAIWNLANLDFQKKKFFLSGSLTLPKNGSHYLHKKTSLIHSDSTWWWQPSWILPWWIQTLPSWIQTPCYLLSDSLNNSFTPLWLLTQTNSISLTWWCLPPLIQTILDSTILLTKTSLIHLHATLSWHPTWILPDWIQTLPSWIQTPCYFLSDSLQKHSHFTMTLTQTKSIWIKLIHSHSNLIMAAILTSAMLDSDILVFPSWNSDTIANIDLLSPFALNNPFTHSFWLNLMMAAILNTAMLDSDTAILDSHTLLSSIRWQPS